MNYWLQKERMVVLGLLVNKIKMQKIAVVLFNIGGPDDIKYVKEYLLNFFSDKNIIPLIYPLRKLLAYYISQTRASKTTAIYQKIGGSSPILKNTLTQAHALEIKLNQNSENVIYKTYVSMRYWHPMAPEVITQILTDDDYQQIICLPLYPQCSKTTTISAYENWLDSMQKICPEQLPKNKLICCYYDHPDYIQAYYELTLQQVLLAKAQGKFKLLFSAHSIPEYLVKNGDPYQDHIIYSVVQIVQKLQEIFPDLDYEITYQSKVGRIKWLGPTTEDVLLNCAQENIIPVIIPIAFVSENSETLYELDMEYKELLIKHGMNYLFRVPTLDVHNLFIESLSEMVKKATDYEQKVVNYSRICGKEFSNCCLRRFI